MPDNRTDDDKAKDAHKTLDLLKKTRQPFEAMVDNILTYVFHGRRKINEGQSQKGQKTGIEVYDSTALSALNLMADGLHGHLANPGIRWFGFELPGRLNFPRYSGMRAWSGKRIDEFPEVKKWLAACEEVCYMAFRRSNFYDMVPEYFRDGGSVGTVTTYVEEDISKGRIIFTLPHFRECFIAENHYGEIDTHYRVYKVTLRQMVQRWTLEHLKTLDPNFETQFEKDKHSEREVLHCIYPRDEFDPNRMDKKAKPFASLWVLMSPKKLIEESGYDDYSPAITWRYRRNNDELYGRSPAWDAYIDILLANQQGRTNTIAGQKAAEPPLIGPADLRGKVQRGPSGWTSVKDMASQRPEPLHEGVNLPFSLEVQDRQREIINKHFHVDFFLMLTQLTAQGHQELKVIQVMEIQGEKAAVLGARIGRLQSEFLNPTIDRVFGIEARARRIPTPPDILLETAGTVPIEVDYKGPLAEAQKHLFKSKNIMAGINDLAILSEAWPEARDAIDPIKTAKELLESRGFPPTCINTDEQIDAIRKSRLDKEQLNELLEGAQQVGDILPKAGKAVEEGSPLALLTENAGM